MRNIHVVAKAVQDCLPEGLHEDIRAGIDNILYEDRYLAPEIRLESWVKLVKLLESAGMPNPFTSGLPWARKIGKIMRAEQPGFREGEC